MDSAAIRLFAEKGYAATGVQDIADAAGISIGLLYRHYKTKDELFATLASTAAEGMRTIVKLFESDGDPKELIEAIANEIHHDMCKDEYLAQMLVVFEQSMHWEDTSQFANGFMQINAQIIQATMNLIIRGQQLCQFSKGDPHEMAIYFFASIQGLGILKCSMGDAFVMPSGKYIKSNF
ncbi:MAG TPA: TetR/AcrR family transcriptional regulator [Lachnospiraceae bacterium]|nr:TetR/AcrR family transcriptional regulator [Lachnospiraceae bacterium]HBI72193.1 TetR/AcrR family transcriptional regulator [Lachnospiraceae bacterium]HBY72695.1 TetR/AcrR family transcriptional regulator [Lachnospiraceae bacterium]HCM12591.1 TetR/AcrR family transcriptional regulator [Lachnospiraceae bacterium]